MKGTDKMLQPDCELLVEQIRLLTVRIEDIDKEVEDIGKEALSVHDILRNIRFQRRVDRLLGMQRAFRGQWTILMDQLAICRTTASTP